MPKLTLSDLTNITGNEQSAITTINNNHTAIETALENTLSRDGTTPNSMGADLDMNSNDVMNVATLEATSIDAGTIEANNYTQGGISLTAILIDWEGQWLVSTAYAVGDVVSNAGSAFICVVAHTSGLTTEPGLGADFDTVWDLLVQGGQGSVDGPATSTDNAVARWNGTLGTSVQNSGVIIDDSNNVSGLGTLASGTQTITGNIVVSGTVDGRDVSTDGTKLDTIETGAEVNDTAAEILAKLVTVDGAGSGLDADLLDGLSSAAFQPIDATLTSLAAYNTNGLIAQTAADTFAGRTLTGPAAGLSVSNGNGVSGNPTLALANDLAALEGLGSTGLAVRTGSDAWAQRTVTGTANQINVANGDGVSGNPTLTLSDTVDLGGATSFEIPNSAAPTVDADGEIAIDTTITDMSHGLIKYFAGEECAVIAVPVAELTGMADGDVITYNAANDEFRVQAGGGGGGLTDIVIQTFTASGTYTPTSGMDFCIIEVQAPGGGGGGADGTGSQGVGGSAGAGGGGGEYRKGVFSAATIGASQTVTINAAGTAGSTAGGNGGNGGTAVVGALITANGGSGGTGSGSNNTVAKIITGGAGGSGGSGGTVAIPGQQGEAAIMLALWDESGVVYAGHRVSGRGGSSIIGFGGANSATADTTGANGQNYGGGGAGGIDDDTTGSAGGAGGAGIVIITEYVQ